MVTSAAPAIRTLVRLLTATLISSGALLFGQAAAHAGVHRAALVIEHGTAWPGTRLLFRCVQFAQDAISGLALLELAGANSGQPPQVYDWGGGAQTVCQIDREPSTVPDRCFGPTSGPNWSDWTLTPNGWAQRSSGVDGYALHDGDVEGWTYVSGFGTPPPAARFSQVCPSPPAAPATTGPPATHPALAATAAAAQAQSATSHSATSDPTQTADLQAVAPTVSTTARTALAETGAAASTPSALPVKSLVLTVVAAASLLALAVINIRRRAP